jgi:hypothetical protein
MEEGGHLPFWAVTRIVEAGTWLGIRRHLRRGVCRHPRLHSTPQTLAFARMIPVKSKMWGEIGSIP